MCLRQDQRNIIDEWKQLHEQHQHSYVWKKDEFDDVKPEETDYLLGRNIKRFCLLCSFKLNLNVQLSVSESTTKSNIDLNTRFEHVFTRNQIG